MKKTILTLLISNLSFAYTLLNSEADLFEKYDFICEEKGRKIIPAIDFYDGGYKVGRCYRQEFFAPKGRQTLTYKVISSYPHGRSKKKKCLLLNRFYIMNEVKFANKNPAASGKILLEAMLRKVESTEIKYPGRSIFFLLSTRFGMPGCADVINMNPDYEETEVLKCYKKEIEEQKQWHSNFNIDDFRDTRTSLGTFETLILGKDKFNAKIHFSAARGPEVECPEDLKEEKTIFSPPSP